MTRWSISITIAFTLLLATLASRAQAATVRHTLAPSDSAFSAATQHACGTYLLQPSPHWCNPALYPFVSEAKIKADVALSADQDAYNTTNTLMKSKFTAGFVDHLFKHEDFQSFSGLARLEALSSYLSFAYTPGYLVGALQISNPNLPEVSAAAARESEVRLTSGALLLSFTGLRVYGGASVFGYDRKTYYLHTNAIALLAQDARGLVAQTHRASVDADAGLFLKPESELLPSFSLTGENLFLAQQKAIGQSHPLDLEPLFRRRFCLGAGYTLSKLSGSYYLGVQLPFWDAFRQFDGYGASIAFIYGIGRLRAFTSFSPLMRSFGFFFMSANYHVGIQYTDDKQDNALEIRRQKNVQLFSSFNF